MTSGFASSEFPSNSNKSKAVQPDPAVEPKVVEQVTTSKVVRRKPSLGSRFAHLFIAGDSDSVMKYVMMDVLLPGARDMVADAVTQYVERMIFGEARSSVRRPGTSRFTGTGAPSYVSYNRMSANKPSPEAPRAGGLSVRARSTHNFDEIIIDSRPEAMEVLDSLSSLIDQYEQATVADFYSLVGETASFTDQKWGWTNIRDADIQRVRSGYILRLPMPIDLKV